MMNDDRESLLSERAYRRIRRMIVSLELAPGSIVRESDLREELDLGRTPIREALLRLSLEKLVTIIPRQGIFVSEITISDLQHLFELRHSLEMMAARLAARRGRPRHWAQMREALAGVVTEDESADNEALVQVDERCHHIMYQASGNQFLERVASMLYTSSLRLWYYFLPQIGDMRGAVIEHAHILEALEAGDGELAAERIEGHIRAFHEEIQAAVGSSSLSEPTR